MTEYDELKPCPFCGGEAKRFTIPNDEFGNDGGDVIECTICGASSHVEFGSKENLNSHWNTRADICICRDDQALLDVVEALKWYENAARDCRKITREGDAARHALHGDGGERASAAITKILALIDKGKTNDS